MSPISFNIYGTKFSERHFSFETVYHSFWDKPYQEINLKSRLNNDYFVNNENCCQICICPVLFWFLYVLTFVMKLKYANYESHWNILAFWDQSKIISDLNMSHEKNAWFCFIFIVWVHFSYKTEKFWFRKSLNYINIFW